MAFSSVPQTQPASRPSAFGRLARILIYGILLLAILVLIVGWGSTFWLKHTMRTSLPQLDGQISIAGLAAPVSVQRDLHGVPHITAANMDDLVFAQGFVTAQDRLWQLDMLRRFAAGDIAEVLGSGMLEHDRAQRILQIRETAMAALAALPAGDQHFLQVYANGVNAFIAASKDSLPAEFRLLRYRPQPWQPVDSLLIGMNLQQILTTEFPTKLAREKISAKLSPDMLADLYPVGSWRDHPPISSAPDITAPQEIPKIPLDASQVGALVPPQKPAEAQKSADARIAASTSPQEILHLDTLLHVLHGPDCRDCTPGSNNWVVSGAHTVTGLPLLSNDMHLDHSIPDTWYEAQLTAGDFNVAGVTLPGLPFVIAGHNAHMAWGFTDMYADVQDVYVEQTQGDTYRTADGWRPFQHVREVIHVRGGHDVVLDVRRTVHGPVITPLLPHESRVLALRWTAYDPAAVTIPFYDIDSATNWEQFRTAFASFGGPPLNAVYGDTAGHIGYQAVGKVPLRPGGLSGVPIADETHEWQGYIPFEQMPSSYDPPGGILATANARITPDDYPYLLTLDWGAPYRNERIWKVLANKPKLSAADMLALQNDVQSELDQELAQRFAYAIDHAKNPSKRQRQAANLLRSWDGAVSIPSPAAAITDAARKALWPMLLEPKLGNDWEIYSWSESDYVEEQMITDEPARWLPKGYDNWNDLLAAAVAKGMDAANAPLNLKNWRYGYAHPVEVEHPLYGQVPWLRKLTGTGVQPQSGDGTTVKQVGRSFGPSERLTVDFSNLDSSTLNIVIGQSGDPFSPYYKDQWPYWYGGTTFSLPFSANAVQASTAHTLTLVPQK